MLLQEQRFDIDVSSEQNDGEEKKLYLSGIFSEANRQNDNGRVYRPKHLQEACDKVNEAARKKQWILGELDHPSTLTVHLERVSHKITEMHMNGNHVMGKAEILPTPKGNVAKALIESGINVGISTRGAGAVEGNEVVDYDFITADLVATASSQDAYPESIYEALDMYYRSSQMNDLAESVKYDKRAQEYFKKEINKFIRTMLVK